ncbi:MAG TPA: FliM/FliN family flagellar motor switch protein [Rhodoblastus sp.]|nr:FliM/FliN family flagellar motor switch protein [Rhodoblastus sp.]
MVADDKQIEAQTKTIGRDLSDAGSGLSAGIDAIPLTLRVVLGTTTMSVGEVARLEPGALVKLDRKLGQPVDLMVDDRLICRGEIGVTEDAPPRFVLKIVELNTRRSGSSEP